MPPSGSISLYHLPTFIGQLHQADYKRGGLLPQPIDLFPVLAARRRADDNAAYSAAIRAEPSQIWPSLEANRPIGYLDISACLDAAAEDDEPLLKLAAQAR